MEICMKSLSGHRHKSPVALFIIALQFYGERGLLSGRPGEECPPEDLRGNGPLYFYKGVGG